MDWKARAETAEEELAEVKKELEEHQESSALLEKELENENKELEAKLKDERTKRQRLEQEVEKLKDRVANSSDSSKTHVAAMETELAKLRADNQRMSKLLREMEQRNDELEETARRATSFLDNIQTEINARIEENEFLKTEIEDRAATEQHLKEEIRDLQASLDISSARLDKLKESTASSSSHPDSEQLQIVQALLDEQVILTGESAKRVQELEEELAAKQATIDELRSVVEAQNKTSTDLQAQLAAAQQAHQQALHLLHESQNAAKVNGGAAISAGLVKIDNVAGSTVEGNANAALGASSKASSLVGAAMENAAGTSSSSTSSSATETSITTSTTSTTTTSAFTTSTNTISRSLDPALFPAGTTATCIPPSSPRGRLLSHSSNADRPSPNAFGRVLTPSSAFGSNNGMFSSVTMTTAEIEAASPSTPSRMSGGGRPLAQRGTALTLVADLLRRVALLENKLSPRGSTGTGGGSGLMGSAVVGSGRVVAAALSS